MDGLGRASTRALVLMSFSLHDLVRTKSVSRINIIAFPYFVLRCLLGKRVWVAESTSGKVLSTLSFTSAIAAAAASNFSKLLPLANALLATDESTAAFVLDVNTVETLAVNTETQRN